jgi:uncharacterized protein
VDGPEEMHDRYRLDKGGKPTFARMMRGLGSLKKLGVELNALTVVHRQNTYRPRDVYRFLKEIGNKYCNSLLSWSGWPRNRSQRIAPDEALLTARAVCFGVVGRAAEIRVVSAAGLRRLTDSGCWPRYRASLRHRAGVVVRCAAAALHLCTHLRWRLGGGTQRGVYSCVHFIYPDKLLGNIPCKTLGSLVNSPQQTRFSNAMRDIRPRV